MYTITIRSKTDVGYVVDFTCKVESLTLARLLVKASLTDKTRRAIISSQTVYERHGY